MVDCLSGDRVTRCLIKSGMFKCELFCLFLF